MSKNKDNEFDFEWDDDSSFDSKLDNFDSDVDAYHGDELKDAKDDRNPVIEKLKSITPTISAVGKSFISGVGDGIGKTIEDDMPSVYQAYTQGTHILSEASIARQEISDKFKPWWNDTKRAIRKLSQQLEGQLPFSLDKKILKLIGEEDRDQEYRQPSKNELRREQMNSNINQIFELQMQKSMEQQKDTVLNRAYDRRVDAIRHKESAGFLSKIAESAVYQHAFTSSVFTAYLKKDLELKYKQFYATEDILGVMTNHAKAVDLKLDAVIKNTALPDADKIFMGERITEKAKNNVINYFSDTVSNYFSNMRKNVVDMFSDMIDSGDMLNMMLDTLSTVLEFRDLDDSKDSESLFSTKNILSTAGGYAGNKTGSFILHKLFNLLPENAKTYLNSYLGTGRNGLTFILHDLISKGIDKIDDPDLNAFLSDMLPDLNNDTHTIINDDLQTLHSGGKITNKFIQAVEEKIPGYLKMQTRYLEMLATGKDSGFMEWDPRTHGFKAQKDIIKSVNTKLNITTKDADLRIRGMVKETKELIDSGAFTYGKYGKTISKKLTNTLNDNPKDIERFKLNLAHSKKYWRITEDILKKLSEIVKNDNEQEIKNSEFYKIAFRGISNPALVAQFWLTLLTDITKDGIVPNDTYINKLNQLLAADKLYNDGRYTKIIEDIFNDNDYYFLRDHLNIGTDSHGNFTLKEADIIDKQMSEASEKIDVERELTKDEETEYDKDYREYIEEKKSPLWTFLKKKFKNVRNGNNAFSRFVDKTAKRATDAVKNFSKESIIKSLKYLNEKVDNSFGVILGKLMYTDENGNEQLHDIKDLTEDDWYEWFISIEHIDDVVSIVGGNSSIAQLLRAMLPDAVCTLLLAMHDDADMLNEVKDLQNGTKSKEKIKEFANKVSEKLDKKINTRFSSFHTGTQENNIRTPSDLQSPTNTTETSTSIDILKNIHETLVKFYDAYIGSTRNNTYNRKRKHASGGNYATYIKDISGEDVGNIDLREYRKAIKMHKNIDKLEETDRLAEQFMLSAKDKQIYNNDKYTKIHELYKSLTPSERKIGKTGEYGRIKAKYNEQSSKDEVLRNAELKQFKYGKYLNLSSDELQKVLSTLTPDEQMAVFRELNTFVNSESDRFNKRLLMIPTINSRYNTEYKLSKPVLDLSRYNTIKNMLTDYDKESIDDTMNLVKYSPAGAAGNTIFVNSDSHLPEGVLLHEQAHLTHQDAMPTSFDAVKTGHEGRGARYEKHADWHAVKDLLGRNDIKGVREFIDYLRSIDPFGFTDIPWRTKLIAKASKRYGYDLNQGLKTKMYAKGDNFDAADIIRNYTNKYNEISGITRGRYRDKASNSLIESTLAGKYFNDIVDLSNNLIWDDAHDAFNTAVLTAEYCDRIDCLLDEIPELDITNHYRQWLDIPGTVRVLTLDISDSELRKHHPDLSDAYWDLLEDLKTGFSETGALKDPRRKNSGYICYRHDPEVDKYEGLELFIIGHELGHIVDERGTVYGAGGDKHSGRGHYIEKHADIYGIKKYLAEVGHDTNLHILLDMLAGGATDADSVVAVGDWRKAKSNGRDGRWRADLIRRYLRMCKYKGDPLYADLDDKDLQPQFRNNYAKGDNISFSLPIDQYGGYVDQPTEILGGSGIAGEAGGETIIPHKFNERFKELIYRCIRDTVSENTARRVLGMLNPSETTEDKLGILLSDNEKVKFASGGSTATDANAQTDTNTTNNNKDEYPRKHPTDTIKNILLNIMESNEAIYNKLGDGLLAVNLDSVLDKLNDSEFIKKILNFSIGSSISNFIHSIYESNKPMVDKVWDFGAGITHGIARNAASFGRHLILGDKVCDVFLGSEIEGQVHGDKKISASEIKNGSIFSDAKCTKHIYSVADIYPPVYRRKIDENGNVVVEEAIREDEAIHGLVDEHGEPLTYFGGKIGRFLRNIVAKPINAIFSKSALEKVSEFGSGIAKEVKHGFAGLFDAYCDVYTTKKLEKPLVRGESIKEGRLVRVLEGGKIKVVPTVFDIDGPCWLLVDDETNPGERKLGNNEVITETDITDGLCHKDGSPIESNKISLAMSRLRRLAGTVGETAVNLASGALHLGGTAIGGLWKAGGWLWKQGKEAVIDAFTAKNPYIDVYVIRNNEKKLVIHAEELRDNKATKRYCYIDKDGKESPVLSAYGISAPVYDMRGTKIEGVGFTTYDTTPVEIISQDDVDKQAIYDIKGNKLTKWAGRSLAGKIGYGALGAVKFGWNKLKKFGRGILKAGSFAIDTLGSILGEGGAAVTSIITNAWNSTLDLFKNTVVSRKDLQEIVGDRLLDIYGLLYKYMPRRKYDPNDKDGDGDVDGSWEDYEQKRKERESKREQEKKRREDQSDSHTADNKEGFWSRFKSAFSSGFGGGDKDDDSSIGDYIFDAYMVKEFGKSGWGALKKAGGGVKKGWAKLLGRKGAAAADIATTAANVAKEPGKIAKAWGWIKGLFGKKAANAAAEKELAGLKAKAAAHHAQFMGRAATGAAGKAAGRAATGAASKAAGRAAAGVAGKAAAKAVGKGLFSKLAMMFGARIAAQAATATAANAVPYVGQVVSIALWALTAAEIAYVLAKDSTKTKNMRSIRCKGYGISNKYWEAIIDLETDTFDEWVNGNQSGVDRDRLRKFGYKVDFMDLTGDDSSKVDFLSAWYKHRFTPMYQFYLGCMRSVGAEFESSPPKDDNIPDDRYAVFVNEFTKHVDKFCNGPTRILRLDKSAYTTWLSNKRKMEHEEGLTSGRYNDANLADEGISNTVNKYTGKAVDHYAYAWNEFRHGNWLNAFMGGFKGTLAGISNIATGITDAIMKNVFSIFTETLDTFGIKYINKNEKAWDKVRFELYGLDESKVRKDEYQRITNIIKEFEIHQVHVIDGEYEIIEDELEELADKLFTAKIRTDIKDRLFRTNGFKDDTSKNLSSEAKSFTISWYKRIFLPIFTAYARVVRTACESGPGDNIDVNNIPEENRLPLLKDFERQSKKFLSRNIDTEILRMSSDGFYTYLIRRSDEDKAELAKDANGIKQLEDLDFTDKLSRSLDESGKNFSQAWNALKNEHNVVKAVGQTIKGIWNGAVGIFKTTGNAVGDSIYDFVYGSDNKHRWETRFLDYGFASTVGSRDKFAHITNDNIAAMENFENESGRLLLEDNTSKPAEWYFIAIMLHTGYLDSCCRALFGANGTDQNVLGMALGKKLIGLSSKYSSLALGPSGWLMSKAGAIADWANGDNVVNSLSELRKYITDKLTNSIAEDKDRATKIKDIEQKISDMFSYLDFWYTVRFKPVFSVFANSVAPYNVNLADIDLDDIPNECRKKALEEYKKNVKSVLMKGNIQKYGLTPQGLAAYLDKIKQYREDIKDGTVDDKTNPLAAYYKEKEDTYAREIIDTVANNMTGVSDEDKKHVTEALSKASVEIDNELGDVSFMAALSAKDALKDLGVEDIFGDKAKVEITAIGKLMELATGYNNYDKVGIGSGTLWDDSLGVVFTDFINDAHKYLYDNASAEDIHNYLTEFMRIYLRSKVFFANTSTTTDMLDDVMAKRYPNVAASNATYKYFSYWFAHRFIPYYTYYVTLVNKANNVDNKSRPNLDKLTPMTRRYVILKLTSAEKKNLIPNRAKALKLTFEDMDKFYKRENALAENKSPQGSTQRAGRKQLLKELEESNKNLTAEIANKRQQAVAESLEETVEHNNLDTVKAMEGVSEGAKVGGKFAKRKGKSLTEKERQEIWDFLTSRMGLTEPQAAAVMGNMMQESGMSCDVINGIGATGICQWLGSRLYGGDGYIGLVPFANAKGLDPLSLKAQLEYFEWEVTRNPYERKRFDDYVRSVSTDQNNVDKTIAACAVGFRKGFERCGKHEAMDNNRVAYSKAFYDKFGGNDSDMPEHVAHYSNNAETLTDNITTGVQNSTSSMPTNIKQYGYSDTDNSPVEGNASVGISGSTTTSLPDNIAKYGSIDSKITKNGDVDTATSVGISGSTTTSNTQLPGTVNGSNVVLPTDSNVITSQFGKRNVKGGSRDHKGIDLRARTGSPIKALRDGVVIKAGGSYNEIFIQHSDGIISKYLHNSKICVRNGQCVKAGELIALAGGKGPKGPNQYGPHLHLGIFKGNTPIDPEIYLRKAAIKLTLKDTKGVPHNTPLSDIDATGTTGDENAIINPSQQTDKVYDNKPETAVAQQNKEIINSAKTTKRSKAMPTPSVDANSTKATSFAARVKDKIKASMNAATAEAEQQNKKPFVEQVKNSADIGLAKATAEASANVKTMYTNDTVEQEPKYTYANMTGEGNNENIRTQNTMQTSITSANNGSAPIVAELQLISNILAGFRGDVNNFIGSLLKGVATQNNSNKGITPSTTVKSNELVSNNIDEKVITEMGDKLLAYVTNVLSTVTNTKLASNVQHTPRILADTYPLDSSKRG